MIRRVAICRANTYDEVRGAVLDALAIAEDDKVPDKYKLRAFEKSVDALLAGQAIHEQVTASGVALSGLNNR